MFDVLFSAFRAIDTLIQFVLHRSRCVSLWALQMDGTQTSRILPMPFLKRLINTVAVLGLAVMLSGCVVYPAWGPYHHHHWGY